jgi:NAD(P)-dependent dehydrogenase (short-subunit alcohol dehydrogenase family)
MSKAVASIFKSEERGAFVHMTSTSGLIGNFGQANYAAAKLGIAGLSKSIALDMQRFNVRSNCISPFAWSRMIATIPVKDEASARRVERMRNHMRADQVARLAIALIAPQAKDVTGQVFVARGNEIFLMSQSRPVRGMTRMEGWTPETICNHAFPAMKPMMYDTGATTSVFGWDPV